jgi:hypothetical protein
MSSSVSLSLTDSSAKGVGSGPGSTVDVNLLNSDLSFVLDASAVSGTSPTADVDIEVLDEASGVWFVLASFTQVTGVTQERLAAASVPEGRLRANWTIGGTATPTVTFSVSVNGKTD